jgi:porin
VRLRLQPDDAFTVLTGVFNGSPLNGRGQDASGTRFPVNGGALAIAEVQYADPNLGTMLYANQAEPLARVYKFGIWYDTESFADQELDAGGLSLANPASSGVPLAHRGDWAWYAVADQMLWQDAVEPDRNVNLFARVSGTPEKDRNLIDFSLNAGLTVHEPLRGRDDDSFGVAMGYAHVSPRAAALDVDTASVTGTDVPVRGAETFVELTYQVQLTPWLQLQPDLQYVFNPGAGVANPGSPGARIGDEFVAGLRANITF